MTVAGWMAAGCSGVVSFWEGECNGRGPLSLVFYVRAVMLR